MKARRLALLILCCLPEIFFAQTFYHVYGEPQVNEGAATIAGAADGSVFVGGFRGDSATVCKADANGSILWTRCMHLGSTLKWKVSHLTVTPDNFLIGIGHASPNSMQVSLKESGFWFKMDLSGNLQWIHRENDADKIHFDEISVQNSTTYQLTKNYYEASGSYNDIGLTRVDAATGNITWDSPRCNTSTNPYIDDVHASVDVAGQGTYLSGRLYTNGAAPSSMRPFITRFDPAGALIWTRYYIAPVATNARLYGTEIHDAGDGLLSTYTGNLSGTNANYTLGAFKTDYNGMVQWGFDYDILGSASETSMSGGTKIPNGYVLYGTSGVGSAAQDHFLLCIDANGALLWAKSYGSAATNELDNHLSSSCIYHQNSIWFTGIAQNGTDHDLVIARTDLSGNVGCISPANLNVAATPLANFSDTQVNTSVSDPVPALSVAGVAPSYNDDCPDFIISVLLGIGNCDPYVLDATVPGATSYLWSNGSTNPILTTSVAGIHAVTVTLNCCTMIDSVNLPPLGIQANLGPDISLCSAAASTLSPGAGFATYAWSTGASTPSITVSSPGTYSVTVTDNGCTSADTVTLNLYPPPILSLGPDQSICTGNAIMLSGGNPGASYAWSNGQTSQSISVSISGIYSLTVTDSNGCTAADTVSINLFPLPNVNLGPDQSRCVGDTVVFDAGAGFMTYAWSNGASSQSINPNAAGSYMVTITDANGCTASDTVALSLYPSPNVYLGPDAVICTGSSYQLQAGNPGATYIWNTGATTPNINAINPGSYSVTVTNANGCEGIDSVSLVFGSQLVVNLGPDIDACTGDTVGLNAFNGNASFIWNTGDATQTISVTSTGNYAVTVMDPLGCTGTDQITVGFLPLPSVDLGVDRIFCADTSITLDPGPGYAAYQWSTGALSQTLTLNATGTYFLTVTDANGCENLDSVHVESVPLPPIDLGADTALCEAVGLELNATEDPLLLPLWSNGLMAHSIIVYASGQYSATVTDASGCSSHDTVNVLFWPRPALDLGADPAFCVGDSVLLDAGAGMADYLWSNGASSQTLSLGLPGSVAVTVTDANGCTNSDSVQLTMNALPAPDLGADREICPGESLWLDAGAGYVAYAWSNGGNGQQISAASEGLYEVTVTDGNGCSGSDAMALSFTSTGLLDLGPDLELCHVSEYRLRSNLESNAYLWSDGSEYPFLILKQTGMAWLTVQTECGPQTDSIFVDFNEDQPGPFVPTAFTPNGDGLNDRFGMGGSHEGEFLIQIFDRWGKLVFQSQETAFEWDGSFAGAPAPEGVYAYRIRTRDCAGKPYEHSGSLSLLR